MRKTITCFLGIGAIGFLTYLVLQQAGYDGTKTHSLSNVITDLVFNFIVKVRGHEERSYNEVSLIIRKLAHFIEYYSYATFTFLVIRLLVKRSWLAYSLILLILLPIPYIDEVLIQSQTIGRAGHYFDLIIDYCAIMMALGFGFLYQLTNRIANRYRYE